MPHIPRAKWSLDWQKDDRFNKNLTEKIILQAAKKNLFIAKALKNGTLTVNAGPHKKGAPDGGGDARLHVSIRIDGEARHLLVRSGGGGRKNCRKNCYEFFKVARLSPGTEFLQLWAVEQRRAAEDAGPAHPLR
ncbi:hypothetical protein [Chelatococcus asaccharovorans]|uniref:hypothetical protein n=1 Tax=Chelatococcus asaccharovorans TaxID=28210 RepID=UPI0011B85637|nr:hypothetical protein [Chelatococcus asaccharovorans]MBS7702935.1 hypothetical protein [Chelatococcus asaccharovorans]